MNVRWFCVAGFRPAFGKDANNLVKSLDLGINGAFIKSANVMKATLRDGATEDQLERQPGAIKKAFECMGWTSVTVSVVE